MVDAREYTQAEALTITTRRYLELGADVVGVLVPRADGSTASAVLGCRFTDGQVVVHSDLRIPELVHRAGIPTEVYDDAIAEAADGWDRSETRLFAFRRPRREGETYWRPDVQFPPEPPPNVDLSR